MDISQLNAMVRFNEDSFTITVDTGCRPVSEWLGLHSDLIKLMQSQNINIMELYPYVLDLLDQMMPDYDTANRMIDLKTNSDETE